jgi:ankyrin repeat protein
MACCSSGGRPKTLQYMLENGADPNMTAFNGITPLHIAVQEDTKECIGLLLSYGAIVNNATLDGVTAMHFAVILCLVDYL